MFKKKQRPRPPERPFSHSDTCKILKADPDVRIEWDSDGGGRWTRTCRCGSEAWIEPPTERTRLDPLDPSTAGHLGQCEYKDVSDPAVLKLVLRIKDGADSSYKWVECASCECGWAVPIFAKAGAHVR